MSHEPVRRPGRWTPRTLRRRVLGAFVVTALLAVAGFGFTTANFADLLADRRYLFERVDPAELAGRDLLAALVDQETGLRGFVLTGEEDFLRPYERGRRGEERAEGRIAGLVGGERALIEALRGAQAAADEWRELTALPVIAAIKADGKGAVSEATLRDGRSRFERFRTTLGALDAALGHERDRAAHSLDESTRRLSFVALGTVGFLIATGLAVLVALHRWVLLPLDRLAGETRAVTAGDFGRVITPAGPAELAALGADIEAMRQRIITELAAATEARALLEDQAEELARSNADLEQFAYVASHDLQEPLRKVASFCQLLERRYQGQLDERADQYIAFAVDGAKRMQALINDLLAFSRVGRTTEGFEPVDCDVALERAMRNLESAIEDSRATVEAGALPTIAGDPSLIAALFQNMIGNALKFRTADAPFVRLGADPGEGEWCFWVADNGIGIDAAYAERIFVIFQRLHGKEQYPGTGIGLAMCKKIVEFHGGRIWVDTEVGNGTTMRWTIPMIPAVADPDVPPTPGASDDEPASEEISVD